MRKKLYVAALLVFIFVARSWADTALYIPVYRFFSGRLQTPVGIFLGWVDINDYRVKGQRELIVFGKCGSDFIETCFHADIDHIVWEDEGVSDGFVRVFHHEVTGQCIEVHDSSTGSSKGNREFPFR